MNKRFKPPIFLAAILVFITACSGQAIRAESAKPDQMVKAGYPAVLGKSVSDRDVTDFIANNNCSPEAGFQLCKDVGMALWVNSNQIINTVYLYSGNVNGFRRYRGELPFGLTFYDPMWKVQEKLRNSNANDTLQQAGLPDEGSSPDHIHYWAVYKRLDMTVIYNSPAADEDAYIYAILINE